jgi:hypothetical protein
MERNEVVLQALNEYLMENFHYDTKPSKFGPTSRIISATRDELSLYLRLFERRIGIWEPNTFVIARIEFSEERKGHGTNLLMFLTKLLNDQGVEFVGIESVVSEGGAQFAKKFGFSPFKSDDNFVISIEDLIKYFQK